jgi:hypothetical protein
MAEEPAPESNKVNVVCGANNQDLNLVEGETLTVGDVREKLADVLNLPPNALAIIGADQVEDEHVLKGGEQLQFIKPSGDKG